MDILLLLLFSLICFAYAIYIIYGLIQIEHNAAVARKKAKEQERNSDKFWNYIDD